MIAVDLTIDTPASARYHKDAIEQIIQSVEERNYCAVLGPRLCGKTLLLRYIEQNLASSLGWTCIYIDLLEIQATTQQAFFADLIRQAAGRLHELTGLSVPFMDDTEASSVIFRGFLLGSLELIQRDLVLLIDPLEALPTDLVQALLTSLRAAYMDQQNLDYQVTVVVSGALSLANLTVGESSPFRGIARRVFVGDLSEANSQELICDLLAESGVSATRPACRQLLQETSGDLFLIRRISQHCADLARNRASDMLRLKDITYITNRFLRDEVFDYAPLLEAIRLIEEDPDLLQCILLLLENSIVHRSDLPIPLSPDLDPLYLTGVVDQVGSDHYRLQNLIYRRFLGQHFLPDRVGHVLTMAGRWDMAIDYLETSILQGNLQSRSEILPATINSIYASTDLSQAIHFLRRGLLAAFGVSEAMIWYAPPREDVLRLVGQVDLQPGSDHPSDTTLPIMADRLEARAYRQQAALRGQEGNQRIVRAIPLRIPGRNPIGVATIIEGVDSLDFVRLRDRDLQMVGFLNQAARALQAVSIRRQELTLAGRMQVSLLPGSLPEIAGWQLAASWRPARETSGDFYDVIQFQDGRLGIVIADVVDKGMGAALLMALSRTLIRSYASEHVDQPNRTLEVANQRLIDEVHGRPFVTLFYGILEPETGLLTYCNAGHPPPLLFSNGELRHVHDLRRTGMPLGVSEEGGWEISAIEVPPGGLLLLYTDGVLDAQNPDGEFFGDERLAMIVRKYFDQPVTVLQDGLLAEIFAFASHQPQADDITLFAIRRLD
jgi:hypothetical protein